MYIISQTAVNNLHVFRGNIDRALNDLLHYVSANMQYDLFRTPHYKLYYLISENIRMDINSLLSTHIELDPFGFLTMRRNIRNSIEAYYDLFNLTADPDYILLLKYHSRIARQCTSQENDTVMRKYGAYTSLKYLYPAKKAEIAGKNGLPDNIIQKFKTITDDSNSYIHPDVFIPLLNSAEKAALLNDLVNTDCEILSNAFQLLGQYCCASFSGVAVFDPFRELEALRSAQLQCGGLIVYDGAYC